MIEMYKIISNPYNFSAEDLFVIGKRDNNPKRSFLFISKLLGKHLSVEPDVVKSTGRKLATLKYGAEAKDDILVIGFCETATALGMSVAAAISGSTYITTTREPITGMPQLLSFLESHSHAPTHRMFSDSLSLNDFTKVILVDDEITTGHSILHLIDRLSEVSRIREFNVMTILDWRSDSDREAFSRFASEHKVAINVYSLVTGQITSTDSTVWHNGKIPVIEETMDAVDLSVFTRKTVMTTDGNISYLAGSGRFGVSHEEITQIESLAQEAANRIEHYGTGKKLLVLGHGENIYIPSRVAHYLGKKVHDVSFRTTSRTPIFVDGTIIRDAEKFCDRGETYNFYNRWEAEHADTTIMLADTPFHTRLCSNLKIFNL